VPDFGDRETYDVIIQSHFEPSLIYCNLPRVTKLAPNLAEKMVILYEYQQRDWFFCSPAQYMNRLQWDRAKFNGWNCYTILGSSGAFDIKDSNVDFFVNDEFEERYNELEIKTPYITFNFGASDPLKDGKRQTKMWPYEYHCKLNEMLKKRFPDIQLIQIGADDVTCVPGADKYILGENLEVTKYVLKNAVCHFDCEGGLVHIATQLGTKCFVVFGPTPVGFFGYSQNTNIVSPQCRECCGLIKDWYTRCYKYDRAECMYAISPETVFYEIERYLLNMGEGS
jgi:ADP-heptose:LPS heptosyltransferase